MTLEAEGARRQGHWLPLALDRGAARPSVTVRAGAVCRAAAEVTWLGLLLVLPSAINPSGALGVEPEKASVLRVAAALIGALWLATRLLAPASGQPVRVSPLLGAALAWLACAGLSTAASIDPVLSLFGSYDREMGLLTLAAGPLLLVVGSDILAERAARERTVAALLLGAVVPCAYALLQQAGRDPLGWSGVVGVVSTFGSPTFLGGYLVLIAPFAAYRLVVPLPSCGSSSSVYWLSCSTSHSGWRCCSYLL